MQGNGCTRVQELRSKTGVSTSRKQPLPLDGREEAESLRPRDYGHDHRAVQREPEPSGSGSCCQRLQNTDGERTPTFYGLLPLSEPNDSGNWAMQPAGETALFPLYSVEQRKGR